MIMQKNYFGMRHATLRTALSGLFMFFMVASHAQGIVDIAPQAQEGIQLGPFQNGWAYVSEKDGDYYINAEGGQIRTIGSRSASLGNRFAIEEYEQQVEEHPNALPSRVIGFEKDGLRGIINPKGEVLVPATYSRIDTEYRQFWTLFKQDKKAHYLPDGTATAFFDDIGYLDGAYFDVKTGDDWHIYHHPSGRVITKAAYEGFDYCGGCGSPARYVYAKKDGKWGVIDWDENVLVPFEYDHEHQRMRNDNWLASFSKNGRPVIVHIPTKREFAGEGELVSGMLIASQDGKQGVYSWDGELVAAFAYDRIEAPNENHYLGYYGRYLVIEKAGLKGLVRSDGEIVVPVAYDDVKVYDDYFVVRTGGLTSLLMSGSSEPILQIEHGEITHINDYFYSAGSKGLAIFKVKQQAFYGLYFAESGVHIEPEFYDIRVKDNAYFPEGVVIEGDRQGQKKLFDAHGEAILPFAVESYEMDNTVGRALLSVEVMGKWGLYDVQNKKQFIPLQYNRFFHELGGAASGLIRATQEEDGQSIRNFVYDNEGNEVIPGPLVRVESIDSVQFLIQRETEGDEEYVVFNTVTRAVEPVPYRMVSVSSSPRLLLVSDDGGVGRLYDVAARKVLKQKYAVEVFAGQLVAIAGSDSRPTRGVWELSYFSNGFAEVRNEKGWAGMIDEYGELFIEPKFAAVRMVHGQYALVAEVDDDTGAVRSYYVGPDGDRVFPEKYGVDDMLFYNQDTDLGPIVVLQLVDNPSLFGLGNLETGEVVAEPVYSNISSVYSQPLLVLTQYIEDEDRWYGSVSKYGLATNEGEVLFEPVFDDMVLDQGSGFGSTPAETFPLLVREGDKWRYVNADGSYLPIEGTARL